MREEYVLNIGFSDGDGCEILHLETEFYHVADEVFEAYEDRLGEFCREHMRDVQLILDDYSGDAVDDNGAPKTLHAMSFDVDELGVV